MAYIGAEPVPGQNREIDDISSGFNGSATAFTLQVSSTNVSPESANNILVNLGGVMQNPGTDYTIAASTITFTTAPASGLSFWALILGAGINTATVADDTIGSSKLIDTAVTAGSYTTADITVDAQGRVTAAANGTIATAEIADGAVNNAKVNASAAIAGSKISPDFGSQNIVTTGTLGSNALSVNTGTGNTCATFTSTDAGAVINLTDNSARSSIEQNGTDLKIISDTDAGDADSTIKFQVDASTKMLINSLGNVGIGATTIADDADHCKLAISGQSGTAAGALQFQDTSNNQDGTIFADDGSLFIVADRSDATANSTIRFRVDGSSEKMRIDSSGRVGIGTASPDDTLVLSGSTGHGLKLIDGTHIGVLRTFSGGAILKTASNHPLTFGTNDTERMRIDSSGRVLIGSSANVSNGGIEGALEVIGTGSDNASMNLARFSNDTHPSFLCFSKSRNGTNGSNTVVQDGDRLGVIAFFGDDGSDYSSEAAEIECEVNGTPGSNDMPGRLIFKTTTDGGSAPSETMRIARSGSHAEVFINTTSVLNTSVLSLATNGSNGLGIRTGATNSQSHISFQSPNGVHGTITTNGANTQYNTSSDYRLKENVTTLSDGITRIKNLLPKRFNFILKPDVTQDGFLAHEVSAVVPEAVSGDKDAVDSNGDVVSQQFDSSKLVPLLVAALQEAITKIETLETKVAALEAA